MEPTARLSRTAPLIWVVAGVAGCLDLPTWTDPGIPVPETAEVERRIGRSAPPGIPARSGAPPVPGYGDGECPPDEFEDLGPGGRPLLPPGRYPLLSLCEGDKDRFRLELAAGDAVYAAVSGSRSLRLELRTSDGHPLAVSQPTPRGGHVGVGAVEDGGEHLLVVMSDRPVSRYSLQWHAVAAEGPSLAGEGEGEGDAAPGGRDPDCTPDRLEPNDHREDRVLLDPGPQLFLTACGDPDWYGLQAGAGELIYAQAVFDFTEVDIDLELYDPAGHLMSRSVGLLMLEDLQARAEVAGIFWLKVFTADERTGGYYLDWSRPVDQDPPDDPPPPPPPPPDGCTDGSEPNNDRASAWPVDDEVYEGLRICPNDDDWFTLRLLDRGGLLAELTPAGDAGDLDLIVFDEQGSRIAISDNERGELEYVEIDSAAPGRYYFLVRGFAGATGGYSVVFVY